MQYKKYNVEGLCVFVQSIMGRYFLTICVDWERPMCLRNSGSVPLTEAEAVALGAPRSSATHYVLDPAERLAEDIAAAGEKARSRARADAQAQLAEYNRRWAEAKAHKNRPGFQRYFYFR